MKKLYSQGDLNHKRQTHTQFIKWIIGGGVFATTVVLAVLLISSNILVTRQAEPITSDVRTVMQDTSTTIFRSPLFQFQAKSSWVEITKNMKENHFFYRSYRGPLIEQDLLIYHDPKPSEIIDLMASRVLPVQVKTDGSLDLVASISEPCGSVVKTANKDPRKLTFNNVTFNCLVDGVIFDVLVGLDGGTPSLIINRPKKEPANIIIYYRDLRANPNGRELPSILETFQTR
jgi:hypothetical protein